MDTRGKRRVKFFKPFPRAQYELTMRKIIPIFINKMRFCVAIRVNTQKVLTKITMMIIKNKTNGLSP